MVLNLPGSEDNKDTQEVTKEAKISDTVDKNKMHQAEPALDDKGEVKENGTGELINYIPRKIKTIKVENDNGSFQIKSYTPVKKTKDENGKTKTETQATEYTLVGYEDKSIAEGKPDSVASDAAAMSFIIFIMVAVLAFINLKVGDTRD